MKKQNLRSKAAIERWLKIKVWKHVDYWHKVQPHVIELTGYVDEQLTVIAEIDLKELVKKRQPLTGIKKQMSAIVSGKKNKKVKK